MVPILKSIWALILFVYANFYFVAITRFNSSFCFSKTFSRKRSSPPPPNFAPPFCAFCLIVCDFLPKTWNLGRKALPGSGLALSVIADAMPPLPKGETLAKPHTLQFNRKLYRHAKGSPFGRGGIASAMTERASPLPGESTPSVCSRWSQPPSPRGRLQR